MSRIKSDVFKFRVMAAEIGLAKLAEKISEYDFHAIVIIGGYEVNTV